MKPRKQRKPKNIYGQVIQAIPDVRELHLREKRMNTRKGMTKTLLLPPGMTGIQLQLYKDQRPKVDDMDPEYVKAMKRR